MGEAQQPAEAQFAEAWVERLGDAPELGENLLLARRIRMRLQHRLQGRPDTGVTIDQNLVAVDQQCTIVSQFRGH